MPALNHCPWLESAAALQINELVLVEECEALEGNGNKSFDLGLSHGFLDMIPKT